MLTCFRPLALILTLCTIPASAQGLPNADRASALGFDTAKLPALQHRLDVEVSGQKIAGASLLVARNGQVATLATAGYADREAQKPFAADTVVRIASMTKPITSTAVMILVDEGKLSLDDQLAKYLPEFCVTRLVNPDGTTPAEPIAFHITIRQLLTHTSGLSYRFIDGTPVTPLYVRAGISDGLSETPGTLADNIARLSTMPLLFKPGEQWHYSLSTDVLGRVVEVVSGQSLDTFFRERIFQPLKMNDTHFVLPTEKRDRLATVYGLENGQPLAPRPSSLIQRGPLVYSTSYSEWGDNAGFYSGGAGLVSTLGDYARFLQMLLNQGELDGTRVLKPETVQAMTTNQLGDLAINLDVHGDGFGYGFGVVTDRGKYNGPAPSGSYSWGGFFHTFFWVDPQNQLLGILFTQTHPSGGNTLWKDVQELTYKALIKK